MFAKIRTSHLQHKEGSMLATVKGDSGFTKSLTLLMSKDVMNVMLQVPIARSISDGYPELRQPIENICRTVPLEDDPSFSLSFSLGNLRLKLAMLKVDHGTPSNSVDLHSHFPPCVLLTGGGNHPSYVSRHSFTRQIPHLRNDTCLDKHLRNSSGVERTLSVTTNPQDGAVGQASVHPHPAAAAHYEEATVPEQQAWVCILDFYG
ncbi:hypothetical protein FHG87_001564 [Trinorchestia longiramus]|nr:hypothetical protein FHG87_001564 [Trinorchestia longiramus]